MRILIVASALLAASSAVGQTACSSPQVTGAAGRVAAIRAQLRTRSVPVNSSRIPPTVAAQLMQLKGALAEAATAAFTSCGVAASAETMQEALATSLRANLAPGAGGGLQTDGKQDTGAFGADLAVQVFQLFGTPRLFEVDFRYGMECGDDNLLLVFESKSEKPEEGWHQALRYEAHSYNDAGDALGDFVLLSPLPGSVEHPVWRYLVAYGRPSCAETPRPSKFNLELLSPAMNASEPERTWHFAHAYIAGDVTPRLATTETTIDFRLVPTPPPTANSAADAASTSPGQPAVFRFRLTPQGRVEPAAVEAPEPPSSSPAAKP